MAKGRIAAAVVDRLVTRRHNLVADMLVNPLHRIQTPAAIVDRALMQRNIERMQSRMNDLGVRFRPHVKTAKSIEVAQAQRAAGSQGITVSTLAEAEYFFAGGFTDILYAVGMSASKLPRALDLMRQGCELKITTDNRETAEAIAKFGREAAAVFDVFIEVDTDGHRSGVRPEQQELLQVGHALHDGGMRLAGVLTHAGSSYEFDTPKQLAAVAEQERGGCVLAAERLRAAGLPCANVSVGSTPTALSAKHLEGVTEVRAGVYVFFDLVMSNVGVCTAEEIALSVLTTVTGHQSEKGWAIVDAGWMAMSRDRGTQTQRRDYGYGQVCSVGGAVVPGYVMTAANQEHGVLAHQAEIDPNIARRFPIGSQLRILPNHACATAAQFSEYRVLAGGDSLATWERLRGW
jgi:D-serine deaminase-like pyridoxal phosphate-dependent protein